MYKLGGGRLMGRDLVTFCLMEEAPLQPGCNGKSCLPKIFGVIPKVSLKVKLKVSLKVKFFKIQNIILPSIGRHE